MLKSLTKYLANWILHTFHPTSKLLGLPHPAMIQGKEEWCWAGNLHSYCSVWWCGGGGTEEWIFGLVGAWSEAHPAEASHKERLECQAGFIFVVDPHQLPLGPGLGMYWALGLHHREADKSSLVSSACAALGRRGSVPTALPEVRGITPNGSLFQSPQPGPGYPCWVQFCGERGEQLTEGTLHFFFFMFSLLFFSSSIFIFFFLSYFSFLILFFLFYSLFLFYILFFIIYCYYSLKLF